MTESARRSLLAGRSDQPLDDRKVRAVSSTFDGLDYGIPYRFEDGASTAFRVETDLGETYGIVVFGRDIYPGTSIIDPNSALSMKAAAAHELSHFHRWTDQTQLPEEHLEHLDEALTSLDAALRYSAQLSAHEIQQLTRDAMQRLQMYYATVAVPDDQPSGPQSPG
ncbi:hypothetical protein ACIGCK_09560 [Microbacterium sp. NPDC078428]|uniref:hypothetical protein n=1 Tax=Microbacterium sp. NPDC078428 TaxID=3364190 RepID=UPI0037C6A63C